MMTIYVPLPRHVQEALLDLAEREARHPKRQAARLIEAGLIQAGYLVGTAGQSKKRDEGETPDA